MELMTSMAKGVKMDYEHERRQVGSMRVWQSVLKPVTRRILVDIPCLWFARMRPTFGELGHVDGIRHVATRQSSGVFQLAGTFPSRELSVTQRVSPLL